MRHINRKEPLYELLLNFSNFEKLEKSNAGLVTLKPQKSI